MSRNSPFELLSQVTDGPLPLGTYKLRGSEELQTTYPTFAQNISKLEPGDKVVKYVDQETGATITIPADVLEDSD